MICKVVIPGFCVFFISCILCLMFLFPLLVASEFTAITPIKESGAVVLFDAAIHDLSTINNYTASWKEGSDIVPISRQVSSNGEECVEFSYRGDRGTACSTIYFSEIPECNKGMAYTGIKLTLAG